MGCGVNVWPVCLRLQASEGQKGLYAYRLEWVAPPADESRAAELSTSQTHVSGDREGQCGVTVRCDRVWYVMFEALISVFF